MIENKFVIYEDTWPSLDCSDKRNTSDIREVNLTEEMNKENKDGWEAVQIKHYTKDFAEGIHIQKHIYEVLYRRKE